MSDTRFKKGFTPWNKGIKTDWTTIILGICEGIPSNKALLLNEAFRNLITLDIQETIDCITKIIKLG